MTPPPPRPTPQRITLLHLDQVTVRVPEPTDVDRLRATVAAAMRAGTVIEVDVVDPNGSDVVRTFVRPASATIAYVTSVEIVPWPGSIEPGGA